MIKRITGLLFVAAAITVIVLTALNRNAYTSLIQTNRATQAGAAASDGNAGGAAGSRRPDVSAGADDHTGVADGTVGTHSTGGAGGTTPENGVVPSSTAPDSAIVRTSPPVEADTRTEGRPASRTDNR